jgi:hypothetical protein
MCGVDSPSRAGLLRRCRGDGLIDGQRLPYQPAVAGLLVVASPVRGSSAIACTAGCALAASTATAPAQTARAPLPLGDAPAATAQPEADKPWCGTAGERCWRVASYFGLARRLSSRPFGGADDCGQRRPVVCSCKRIHTTAPRSRWMMSFSIHARSRPLHAPCPIPTPSLSVSVAL